MGRLKPSIVAPNSTTPTDNKHDPPKGIDSEPQPRMSFKRIDVPSLKQMLVEQQVIIADIRDDASFGAGHIDGSVQLGNDTLPEFIESYEETDPIVVVCYHGHSSQPVAAFLAEQGFSDVYSLDGGYTDWAAVHS